MSDSNMRKQDDDDDVDFMSDEFLKECTKQDIRPGLLFKSSDKRQHEQLKRQNELRQKQIGHKEMEEVNRKAGLDKAIGADNKGFQMLEKMGFTPGTSLGKRSASVPTLKEPIPIKIKHGRGCLGQQTVMEEKRQKKEVLGDVNSFRERLQLNSAATQTKLDLERARRICQTLDEESGRNVPIEPWYWPPQPKVNTSEDEFHDSDEEPDDSEDPPNSEQLETVVAFLRTTYFYCIWCGVKFDDAEDVAASCPGLTREDH